MLIDYQKANIYQADGNVLHDVDFQVDADQFVYVIGKVGSGKSSLLKTIYCEVDFDKEDADKAEVLGRDLLNIKRKEIPSLRREMGIIFQDSNCCTIVMYIAILSLCYIQQVGNHQRR